MIADIERLESAARLAMGSLDMPSPATPDAARRGIAPSLLATAIAVVGLLARKLR